MTFLSICIPTYNRINFLEELVLKFEDQIAEAGCFESVEIVISDNNSADTTRDVILNLSTEYKNIVYNKNESNIGGIKNIINVINLASGKYIWLFSDDDLPYEGALAKVLSTLEGVVDVGYATMDIGTVSKENVVREKVFLPTLYEDRLFPAKVFLSKYLYVPGFLSINIMRRDYALEFISDEKILEEILKVGWPHLVLSALIINKSNGAYVIASPQVMKRDGNLIFGPKQLISAYILDPIRIVGFLFKMNVAGIKADANYRYMFDWEVVLLLFLHYLYTGEYIKINYFKEMIIAFCLAKNIKLKTRLLFCSLIFIFPKKIASLVVYFYYCIFKDSKLYYEMKDNFIKNAKAIISYFNGEVPLHTRTYCKDEL